MKLTSKSVLINAPLRSVWTKLIDWHTWTSWDGGMETISFGDQTFQVGTVGKLKMKGGPAVDLTVTEFTFEKSYTSEFDLWGSHFVFIHYLDTVTVSGLPQVRATVDAQASGCTSAILGSLFKVGLDKEMLGWLEKFRDLVEADCKN